MNKIDYRDMINGNIYAIGDLDDEDTSKYKLLSEDDDYFLFENVENGKTEKIPSYILNETNIYDITKLYKGIKLTNQRFNKDIASNVSEYLGINPKQLRKNGGRKRNKHKSRLRFRLKQRRSTIRKK